MTNAISDFRHPSGIHVLHLRMPEAPVVSMQVSVAVGAADETVEEAGLAHVHEHMLFKGTERRTHAEIAGGIESLGGSINAFTSHDQTVYFITVPSENIEEGADILLDMLQHSTFDADELKRELQVIQEEILRSLDNPARGLMQQSFETIYSTHPYRLPVIGTRESVDSFGRDDVVRFYKRWYQPSNMTLAIVGDISREQVTELLDRQLGTEAAPDAPPRPGRAVEPARTGAEGVVSYRDLNAARLQLVFPGPSLNDEDVPALEVLMTLLGDGRASWLYEKLKLEEQVVDGIYAYAHLPQDPGLVAIGAAFDVGTGPARAEEVIERVARELGHFRHNLFSESKLEAATRAFEASVLRGQETSEGTASRLLHFKVMADDLNFEQRFVKLARAVTPEGLRDVARKYLDPRKCVVSLLLPSEHEAAGPAGSDLVDAMHTGFERATPARESALRVKTEDPRGVAVYEMDAGEGAMQIVHEHDDRLPIFNMTIWCDGGMLAEPARGVATMAARALLEGTLNRSAKNLADRMELVGAELGCHATQSGLVLSVRGLSRDFDTVMGLLSEVVFEASYPDEGIEKNRVDLLRAIDRRAEEVVGLTFHLLRRNIFGHEHPYARYPIGEKEDVNAISREQTLEFARRSLQPELMIVGICGDISREQIAEVAGQWSARSAGTGALAKRELPSADQRARHPGVYWEFRDREQSHVAVAFRTVDRFDARWADFTVLKAILSGQGGRLFTDLRDRRSLAYSVTALATHDRAGGYFGAYIGTSPEKVDEAIAGLREHLYRVASERTTEQEVERAKRTLTSGHATSMQRRQKRAHVLTVGAANDGSYAAQRFDYPAAIDAVTADSILEAAAAFFVSENEVVGVVGPENGKPAGANE